MALLPLKTPFPGDYCKIQKKPGGRRSGPGARDPLNFATRGVIGNVTQFSNLCVRLRP